VKDYPVGALVAIQLGVCGVFSLILASSQGDLTVPNSTTVWSALIVTSLFASALGFLIQTYAQTKASPARTALILASEPAFAGMFAYLLKGESLSALGWVGALLIMGAIVTVEALPYLPHLRPLPER
jgi:drug/metabolite transporter (DMT)-like permease